MAAPPRRGKQHHTTPKEDGAAPTKAQPAQKGRGEGTQHHPKRGEQERNTQKGEEKMRRSSTTQKRRRRRSGRQGMNDKHATRVRCRAEGRIRRHARRPEASSSDPSTATRNSQPHFTTELPRRHKLDWNATTTPRDLTEHHQKTCARPQDTRSCKQRVSVDRGKGTCE